MLTYIKRSLRKKLPLEVGALYDAVKGLRYNTATNIQEIKYQRFLSLINGLRGEGKFDDATKRINIEMKTRPERLYELCSYLVSCMFEAGQMDEAFAIMEQLTEKGG